MDHMEHAIEKAAEVIGGHVDHCIGIEPDQPLDAARALAEAGMLAPAPLTEEWHAAYYGVTRDGVRHLRLIGTEGSREHAEAERADCAQDDPDTEFFLVRRPVHDWLPVDRAEGDGSAEQ